MDNLNAAERALANAHEEFNAAKSELDVMTRMTSQAEEWTVNSAEQRLFDTVDKVQQLKDDALATMRAFRDANRTALNIR